VLEVEGTPFGPDGGTLAEEVRDGVEACYGTAGPAFVEAVRGGLADGDGLDRLRARHRRLAEEFKTGGNLARRRAPYVAVLRLVAEIAHKAKVLPFKPPEAAVWAELFSYADSRDDRPGEALELVWSFIDANPSRVLTLGSDAAVGNSNGISGAPRDGWAGKWLDDGAAALWPSVVAEVLEVRGYSFDAVKSGWGELGAVRRDKDGRYVYPVKFDGRTRRMVVFESRDETGE
jgi:hypothetical protein